MRSRGDPSAPVERMMFACREFLRRSPNSGERPCERSRAVGSRSGQGASDAWTMELGSERPRPGQVSPIARRPIAPSVLLGKFGEEWSCPSCCSTSKRVLLLPERFPGTVSSARPSTLNSRPRLRRGLWLRRSRAVTSARQNPARNHRRPARPPDERQVRPPRKSRGRRDIFALVARAQSLGKLLLIGQACRFGWSGGEILLEPAVPLRPPRHRAHKRFARGTADQRKERASPWPGKFTTR